MKGGEEKKGGEKKEFPMVTEPRRPEAPNDNPGPLRPVREAPARFGAAGLSGGEGWRMKRSLMAEPVSDSADALSRFLGWFSIGLGAAEVFGGRSIGAYLGMEGHAPLLRLYGAREIANGVAILARPRPRDRAPWVWGRVAGDALDLATLGAGLDEENPNRGRVAAAIAAVAAVAVVDVLCGIMLASGDD